MRDHLASIMALTPEGIEAFDTNVPAKPSDWDGEWPPQRYVVFRAPTFTEVSATIGYAPDVDDWFSVMAVGRDANQARAVQEAMKDALHRSHPVVEGYSTYAKRRTAGPVATDDSIKPSLSHATDLYHYRATPA